MRNYKRIVYQLISIFMGGLLCSCASVSHVDEEMIQQKMQNYLEKETGVKFLLEKFEPITHYQHGAIKHYHGTFHEVGDKRLAISLSVNELDNYTQLLSPEEDIEQYLLLKRAIAISDQVKKISQSYFEPEDVHTHTWTEAVNFHVKIYLKDEITPQNIAQYVKDMQAITSKANKEVGEIEDNYFEITLHIFENDYKLPEHEAKHGAVDYNGPTGDYTINTDIDSNENVAVKSQLGLYSKRAMSFRKKLADQFNLKDAYSVHNDYHPHTDWYPEDLDNQQVRHFARYMVPIYDTAHKEVIRRDYFKVNIFTGEMTLFQPTHP